MLLGLGCLETQLQAPCMKSSQIYNYIFSIYTLSDLGDLSNLIGSLSRTIQQYSPPSKCIMCELGVFPIYLENDLLKVDKILGLTCVVVQFYPWFKFYFPLFLGMVMYDNEFKTKGNKI